MFAYAPKVKALTKQATLLSLTYDGEIHLEGDNYTEVHDALMGDIYDSAESFSIGQIPTPYGIKRDYLFFETKFVSGNSYVILDAKLSLYVGSDLSNTDFNVTVQNGQPTYPHTPLQTRDYDYSYYSGDGGSKNTTTITGVGYWNISLNGYGKEWINRVGLIKLCLRSSRDINEVTPTGIEFVTFGSREIGEDQAPKLYVTYQEEEYPSSGDSGNGEPTSPIDIPEITVPKIPTWGYYLILGSVCVVALASLFTKAPRSKHGPKGVKVKKTSKRYPKRNKKGRFT